MISVNPQMDNPRIVKKTGSRLAMTSWNTEVDCATWLAFSVMESARAWPGHDEQRGEEDHDEQRQPQARIRITTHWGALSFPTVTG